MTENDIDIEISEEEVEYLVLQYLKSQLDEGKELIHIKELFEYMGCEWDKELDGDFMIHLTDEGQNVMSIIAHDKKKLH
jgi:hypothetical protein